MTLVKALSNLISNILLIVSACLVIFAIGETGVRTYTTMNTEGGSFFRENRFISPWFTSYDAPPPHFDDSGNAYFRHRTVPVSQTKSEALVRIVAVGGSTTANERPFAIDGRDYVRPDDVKQLAHPVLAHRLLLSSHTRLRGRTTDDVLDEILSTLPVPIIDPGSDVS